MGYFRVSIILSIMIWIFTVSFLLTVLFVSPPSGQEDYSFQELLPMAVIGVIGGLLGTFLVYLDHACSLYPFSDMLIFSLPTLVT